MKVAGVKGIVTWKLNDGFFMQEETPDNKDCTSEGIFIFTNNYPEAIPGDKVSVDGTVQEFTPGAAEDANLSVTELSSKKVIIISGHNELPEPVLIGAGGKLPPDKTIKDDNLSSFDIASDGLDFYESLEGMRVEIKNAIVVGSVNTYNEIFVIPAELENANIISGEGALVATQIDNNPERMLVSLPDGYKKSIKIGDRFTVPIIGVLDYEYGNYRVLETNTPEKNRNSSKATLELAKLNPTEMRIVSYNVNNFTRFDEEKVNDLASQIVVDLGLPDILVLQEIQDDTGTTDDGVTSAAKNLNALIGQIYDESGILYHFIDPKVSNNSSGGQSGGNIRTVILYRTDRGLELKNDSVNWPIALGSVFSNSRIPVLVEFSFEGEPFYVIGVHLVSNNLNTPLFGAFQPIQKPEEGKKIQQGEWIAKVVSRLQTEHPDIPIIIAGDFNDVPWSTTLSQFSQIGLENATFSIPEAERYSILYEGNASLFDQILISPDLSSSVTAITIVHSNTSDVEKNQISDHDPVLLDIQF
jgi:predicted extracellular nuclease